MVYQYRCKIISYAYLDIQNVPDYIFTYSSISDVDLTEKVVTIGYGAFQQTGLKSIALPNTIREIKASAFKACSLTEIYLPDGLEIIGESCFESCNAMLSIFIPKSVVTIGKYAFKNAGSYYLSPKFSIRCEASSCPIGWDSYWNHNGLNFYSVTWNQTR